MYQVSLLMLKAFNHLGKRELCGVSPDLLKDAVMLPCVQSCGDDGSNLVVC